jgi:antibiotic biosynthesis monooxygenase (ABM) superfamily enzyme
MSWALRHREAPKPMPVTRMNRATTIVIPLVVPIYARITPKVGDFPFFYFFLLAFMPVVALALWVVTLLQRRLNSGRLDNPKGGQR